MSQYVVWALALAVAFIFLRGSYTVTRDGKRKGMFADALGRGVIIGLAVSAVLIVGFLAFGL